MLHDFQSHVGGSFRISFQLPTALKKDHFSVSQYKLMRNTIAEAIKPHYIAATDSLVHSKRTNIQPSKHDVNLEYIGSGITILMALCRLLSGDHSPPRDELVHLGI